MPIPDLADFLSQGDKITVTLIDKSDGGRWVFEAEGVLIDGDSNVDMKALGLPHRTLEEMLEGVRPSSVIDVDMTIRLRVRRIGDRMGQIRWEDDEPVA